MKAKAMVMEGFNKPLVLQEIAVPALTEGQLLVKINASGVCGSDVHMWRGEDPRIEFPMVLGHEGVGRVVDFKGPVRTVQGEMLAIGDFILWNRGVSCGRCYACAVLKEPSLCSERLVYGINRPLKAAPHLNGCYADHIILAPGTHIFKIAKDVDPAVLVSASCSGATIAHAFDLVSLRAGDTVVVQGPGPLGIYAVAFARKLGASQVIIIGGSPARLELCRQFGATMVLDRRNTSEKEREAVIRELTGGRGADLVVEAAGQVSALEEGLRLVRAGGAYLATGFAQPAGLSAIDPYEQLVRKNIRLQGVWVSDASHTYQAMQLLLEQPQLFGQMVSHRFRLEEANEALAAMAERTAVKAVLLP